jgi:hypothetical protein
MYPQLVVEACTDCLMHGQLSETSPDQPPLAESTCPLLVGELLNPPRQGCTYDDMPRKNQFRPRSALLGHMLFSNPNSTAPRFRIDVAVVAVVVIRIFPSGSYIRSWPSSPGAPEGNADAERTRRTRQESVRIQKISCHSEKISPRGWEYEDTERSGSNRL